MQLADPTWIESAVLTAMDTDDMLYHAGEHLEPFQVISFEPEGNVFGRVSFSTLREAEDEVAAHATLRAGYVLGVMDLAMNRLMTIRVRVDLN